jgi:DNA-binding transcriptional ArsR family regulator
LYIGIFRFIDIEKTIAALNNPIRRQIIIWLKHRSNFPPALPEHESVKGVCIGYIQEKAGLSQSTISNYMAKLKQAGLVDSERHGQWTFYRRNEDAIRAFVIAVEAELLAP